MFQKLFTKKYGELKVVRSWQEGPNHIALLTNGAYVHITGLPVKTKAELQAVLTGEDLEKAENWFDHRHEEVENPPLRIMFEADGTPIFEDGTPVESPSDLVQSLKPGPVLDAALVALARKMAEKQDLEALANSKVGEAAFKVAEPPKSKRKPVTELPPVAPVEASEQKITV
jgi:hypothetical protein